MFKFLNKNFKYLNNYRSLVTNKNSTNILAAWKNKFKSAELEDPDFCIKVIVAHVLKQKLNQLPNIENIELNDEQLKDVEKLCECRMARMPLQYILGEWDFLDVTLKLLPPVFIPRPETEGLVQLILSENRRPADNVHFLEIGCGSGAISLYLLRSLKQSTCIAIDCSKHACDLTKENSNLLNVNERITIYHHKVTDDKTLLPENLPPLKSNFDLIVSNPPYVKTSDLPQLPTEILYENVNALDGGPDGLKIARNICKIASLYLKSGGHLWMELDSSHPTVLEKEINENFAENLKYSGSYKDMFGKLRYVEIVKI